MIPRRPWTAAGVILLALAALLLAPPTARSKGADDAAAAAADRPAELKVLDRWVGEWDMEASIKPNEFMPQGSKSTYATTIRWAINGRFLRCDAEGSGSQGDRKFKDAFMWVASFDPNLKAYTSTVFWANVGGGGPDMWGGGLRGVGKWDEAAKTLTIVTNHDNGVVDTSVTTWADADHHGFVSSMKDQAGKVVMEMSGKATRRK